VVELMDRIEKALHLAKDNQATVANSNVTRVNAAHIQNLQRIQYTHTKVVRCSPAVLKENKIIAGSEPSEYMDAYRVLRTQVLKIMQANGWNTLGITSPSPGNGKTLTAINLAISLAREVNHTVLLADLDLRKPTVHKYLGYEPFYGISDYVTNNVPVSEILFCPSIRRLVVMPGNQPILDSSEMITAPKTLKLINELKNRYRKRIVLYDLPPVLVNDDTIAFSQNVDAMLVVVEEGKTQKEELTRTLELLGDVNIIGTVLNNAEDTKQGYYGYGY
jgi:capsular exopolysaccharide synthesis family protein